MLIFTYAASSNGKIRVLKVYQFIAKKSPSLDSAWQVREILHFPLCFCVSVMPSDEKESSYKVQMDTDSLVSAFRFPHSAGDNTGEHSTQEVNRH